MKRSLLKRSLLKKAIAVFGAMSMLLASVVIVSAYNYKDTSFPYSNDFDHWGTAESWAGWLIPDYGTGLGATVYGSTSTPAQIVYDEDEEHNLVFHMSRPATDGAERFIYWVLPSVGSGKYVFEFDAKTTGNGGIWYTGRQSDFNTSGEPKIVSMSNNAIYVGDEIVSSYEIGEWKSFKVLFDVESGDVTVFVDGKNKKINNSLFKTARSMYFVVNADATMSLDNIKSYFMNGDLKPSLVLEENGKAIGNFVDEDADSLVLSINESEFSVIPEISVTCLGEDIISQEDDYVFGVTTQLSNGDIIITPEDYFEAGSRYSVQVAEGTTDIFGRALNNTTIMFKVAEDCGVIRHHEVNEDFNIDTLPTASGQPLGTTGKIWNIADPAAIELISEGVQLKENSQLETDGGFWKKGKVYLHARMDMGVDSRVYYDTGDASESPLFLAQHVVDLNGDGVNDKSINFMKQAPAEYGTVLWDARKIKNDGFEDIEYILDIDNSKSYVTYNGESFIIDAPYNAWGNGVDFKNKGFQSFRIHGSADPLKIDCFNYWHEYTPAVVEEIAATNVVDNRVAANSQIAITFSESIQEDSLSNITVSAGEENATYTGVWNAETLTYTLSFDSKLKGETLYTVTVPEIVTDYSGLPVDTAYGTFITEVVPPMDVENLAATRNGAAISVTADVLNPADGTVYMVVAGYKNYVLETIEIVPVTTTESTTGISETVTLTTDVDTVKAFALYDMATIKPYCPAVIAE